MAASVAALQAHSPEILWLSAYDAGAAGLTITPGTPDICTAILDYSGNARHGTDYSSSPVQMSGTYTTHHGPAEFPQTTSLDYFRWITSVSTLNDVTLTYMGPMSPVLANTGSEVQLIQTPLGFLAMRWQWGAGNERGLWWASGNDFAAGVAGVPNATSWPSGDAGNDDAVVIYGITREDLGGGDTEWRIIAAYWDGSTTTLYEDTVTESATAAGLHHSGLANNGVKAAGMTGVYYRAMDRSELVETLGEMAEFHSSAFAASFSSLLSPPGPWSCECVEAEYGFRVALEFAGLVEEFASVDGSITETLDMFELSTGDRSFPLTVTPVTLDIPALILDGHRLDDATVRIYRGTTLVMVGRPEAPRWGRAGEPIRMTVREDPWSSGDMFPSAWDQRITVVDSAAVADLEAAEVGGLGGVPITSAHGFGYRPPLDYRDAINANVPPYVSALGLALYVDKVSGRAGPIVFGSPGYQDGETWGASPAYWVDTTEGAERLMIARHRVAAANVTVYGTCVDGVVRGKVAPVEHVTTPSGVTIAVAEVSTLFGRAPVLEVVVTHDALGNYTLNGETFYRNVGGQITSTTWSATWVGGASVNDTYINAFQAMQTVGFEPPYSTLVVETAGSVITLTYTMRVGGVLVFGHPYDIDILGGTGATGGAAALSASADNVGIDVSAPDDFALDFTADFAVGWHDGEGLPGGAGDVINYLLNQTTIRLDRGRLESYRSLLNGYRLAGYIDSQVNIMEYLSSQLAWMPIAWIAGKEGLYCWLFDPDLIRSPVATLTEADNFRIDGDVAVTSKDPISQVQLTYRHREDTGEGEQVTTQRSLWARTSSGQVEDLATDLVDDSTTAHRAAAVRQLALGERHPVVFGTVGEELDWLRAGDPVYVVAPSRGVTGYGIVSEVIDDGTSRYALSVTVLSSW